MKNLQTISHPSLNLKRAVQGYLDYNATRIRTTNREIHKDLSKLETALAKRFHQFYNEEVSPSLFPIEVIKSKHQNLIRAIIRSSIEKPYLNGALTVNNHYLKERNPNFLFYTSGTDIENIKAITERMSEQFWIRTGKLLRRNIQGESKNSADNEQTIRKPDFDIEAAMEGLAVHSVYGGFNSAVKSKLFQIEGEAPGAGRTAATVKGTIRTLTHSRKSHVIFVTKKDAKVCQQFCAPLNGTIWEIDDPDIVIPPFDLHYYCRCILQPLSLSEESSFLPFVE